MRVLKQRHQNNVYTIGMTNSDDIHSDSDRQFRDKFCQNHNSENIHACPSSRRAARVGFMPRLSYSRLLSWWSIGY